MRGRVEHATTCELRVLSHQSFPVIYSHNPTSACRDGSYSAHITIGPNPAHLERSVAFALVARNASSSYVGRFYLALAAQLPPEVLRVIAAPSEVPPHGGQVTVRATLKHAKLCQLVLLSKQSFPVVYANNVRPCTSTFTAHITVGGNPTPIQRTIAFALVARSGTSRWTAPFYVGLAALSQATPTTAPPAAATTVAPATTLAPATTAAPATTLAPATSVPPAENSNNWSGYVAGGGTFTEVKGTFTVPYITTAANCEDALSEWVGIDGWGNSNLIQAGVSETMQNPSTGTCTQGEFYTWPWWENLPAPSTPDYSVTVNAGDSVTVTIWQLSSGDWEISLTDSTNGEGFSVEQPYDGPLGSAEWVTEAYSTPYCADAQLGSLQSGSYICPLAPYSPAIQFSGLGIAGSNTTLLSLTMWQYGQAVSTPSNYSAGAFSTSYTGTTNGPWRPSLSPMARRLGQLPAPIGKYRQIYETTPSG